MKFNEGTIILKELQRLCLQYYDQSIYKSNIWLSSDAFRGIAEYYEMEYWDKFSILEEIEKKKILPMEFIEQTFKIEPIKNMDGSIPDILCYIEKSNFSFYIAEEVKKRSNKNAISQILCFRPWVDFCYGVMPDPSGDLRSIFQRLNIGLINILNPAELREWDKLEKDWEILSQPISNASFDRIELTHQTYQITEGEIVKEDDKFSTNNPLITSFENKPLFSAVVNLLGLFKERTDCFDLEEISNYLEWKFTIRTLQKMLSGISKYGFIRYRNERLYLNENLSNEVCLFNRQLRLGNMNIEAYNAIIKMLLIDHLSVISPIRDIIMILQQLGGKANMVEIFKEVGKTNPYNLYKNFTNGKRPHNVDFETEQKCKGCEKDTACSHYLAEDGKIKLEEIWKSTGFGIGYGTATKFFECLNNDDKIKMNEYINDELRFPLYVKMAVAQSLTHGKSHLGSFGVLENDIQRDKARGEYCPLEDVWVLSEEWKNSNFDSN